MGELGAALWQGLLIGLGAILLLGGVYALAYWFSWGSRPHWLEGFRDRFKLWNLPDNRFWPWIHQDTEYWIVRVRFDKGAIVVAGRAPPAHYWSVNYYPAKTNVMSIDSQSVRLDEGGRYRITIGREVENSLPEQSIKVDPGVTRAVIELRVTLKDVDRPLVLPGVRQGGRLLVEEREA